MIKREGVKPGLSEPVRRTQEKRLVQEFKHKNISLQSQNRICEEMHPGLGLTSTPQSPLALIPALRAFTSKRRIGRKVANLMDHPPKPLRATSPLPQLPLYDSALHLLPR